MAVSGSFASDSRQHYFVKGALEVILPRCRAYHVSDDSTPSLDALTRSLIIAKASAISSRGMRVVGMAYAHGPVSDIESATSDLELVRGSVHPQANLIFAGFQAMMDPPRKGVADAITSLHEGGVKVVMITGDSVETAMAIGRQLGLLVHGGRGGPHSPTIDKKGTMDLSDVSAPVKGCMTGKELDAIDDQMLRERVAGISVFARTSPRHKMRIVAAYQARGAVVGMTGDGGKLKISPLH